MGTKVFINPGHSPKGDPDPGALASQPGQVVEHVTEITASAIETACSARSDHALVHRQHVL